MNQVFLTGRFLRLEYDTLYLELANAECVPIFIPVERMREAIMEISSHSLIGIKGFVDVDFDAVRIVAEKISFLSEGGQ